MKTTSAITLWIINTCRYSPWKRITINDHLRSWNKIHLNGSFLCSRPCRSHRYIPFTWSTSKKKYPLHSDYMKYFEKNIHYIPITWSTSENKLSSIIRLHEVLRKTNYPLYSDYMKHFEKNYPLYCDYMKYFEKTFSTILRLHEVLRKIIIHYFEKQLSTIFRLHEVLRKTNYPV